MKKFIMYLGLIAFAHAMQYTLTEAQQRQFAEAYERLYGRPTNTNAPATSSEQRPNTEYTSSNYPCRIRGISNGVCVPYYLCLDNHVITDGRGLLDISNMNSENNRFSGGSVSRYRSKCPSNLEVCCIPPAVEDTEEPPNQPKGEGCGWRNPNGVDVAAEPGLDYEAKFGEFPWMVAIFKLEEAPEGGTDNAYIGEGSLIHPSAVLTAAYHLSEAATTRVRAGDWIVKERTELHPHQDRDVSSIEIHEHFNNGNLSYNIALIFLNGPMDLAPNVGLACLPPPRQLVPDGTECVVSSWSKDKFGDAGVFQNTLRKVEVPIVDRRKCQRALRSTRLGPYFTLHSTFMCAGDEHQEGSCKGGSGSPLMCRIENQPDRYMQSGIGAWSIGCGEGGTPGVFVAVSEVREWIDQKILDQDLDPDVYTY